MNKFFTPLEERKQRRFSRVEFHRNVPKVAAREGLTGWKFSGTERDFPVNKINDDVGRCSLTFDRGTQSRGMGWQAPSTGLRHFISQHFVTMATRNNHSSYFNPVPPSPIPLHSSNPLRHSALLLPLLFADTSNRWKFSPTRERAFSNFLSVEIFCNLSRANREKRKRNISNISLRLWVFSFSFSFFFFFTMTI